MSDETDTSTQGWRQSWIKYLVAGVLTGIFVAFFLYIADHVGSMWGGLIATLPISLITAIFFIKASRINPFMFALALGSIAYFFAIAGFIFLSGWSSNKWVIIGLSLLIWTIIIGLLFWYFSESLKDHDD